MMFMKKIIVLALIILPNWGLNILKGQQAADIRVEPPHWWEGMEYNNLEILIYGENVAQYTPLVNGAKVSLRESVKVANPNYLFLNVDITESARKGFTINLVNNKGKVKKSIWYELKKRQEGSRLRKGFNSSDVIYLLMPDRFANGNPGNDSPPGMLEKADRKLSLGRHGGDLQGIINHLNYIEELGYTALWLNPVLENNMEKESYHGYAVTDLYKVDARLGTNEDYKKLVNLCHEKGMKVIKDMVFNHIGTNNYLIKDQPMPDWVHDWGDITLSNFRGMAISDPYSSEYDKTRMNNGWFDTTMADLNQKNPRVLKYLVQNSIWWIEYAGLDGIRMDTYPYPDKDAMAEWAKTIRNEYPNFTILAESWLQLPLHTAYWQENTSTFDGYNSHAKSVTDFPTSFALSAALNEQDGWREGWLRIYYNLSQDGLYSSPKDLVIFPDNHDIERFARIIDGDINKFKNGIAFYLTTRGIPQIYYGTEIMMDSKPYKDHGSWRRDYPGGWEGDTVNAFTGEGLTGNQLEARDYMKKLMNWRKNKPVIHTGKLMQFIPENNIYVYCRYTDNEAVLVILNKNPEQTILETDRFQECLGGYGSALDVISGKEYKTLNKIELPPNTPLILELK